MNNPIFQMSADARLITQHLQKIEVGQTVTYAALSALVSHPVDATTGALRTALNRVLKDQGFVFACIIGVGFKRLSDAEIVAEGSHAAEAVRRKARRSVERQLKADFSSLSRDQQARFTAQVSVLASIAFMAGERQLDKIAACATPQVKEIPISATLAMFAGKGGA